MNPADIAKDAIRLATTHGLSKDVIDLMEKKIGLLTEEIASLTKERDLLFAKNIVLNAEKSDLSEEILKLKQKPKSATTLPEGADETTERIISAMFSSSQEETMERLSTKLGMALGMIQFQFDILLRHGFVRMTAPGIRLGNAHNPARYVLDSAGLAFAAKNSNS
jgi:response regulator of citrate/malate metabolism